MSEGYAYVFDNIVNDKHYCGSHNDNNPTYFGSGGVHWQAAKKKWGRENLPMRIIYRGAHFREAETLVILTLDLCNDPMWYNKSHIHKTATFGAEHRAKISAALKGRKQTPELIAKRTAGMRGIKRSAESRAKQSATTKGNKAPTRGMLGMKHTDESRQKMSDKLKGMTPWNVGVAGCANHLNGKTHTCVHCGITTTLGNIKRWHNDNCKKGLQHASS